MGTARVGSPSPGAALCPPPLGCCCRVCVSCLQPPASLLDVFDLRAWERLCMVESSSPAWYHVRFFSSEQPTLRVGAGAALAPGAGVPGPRVPVVAAAGGGTWADLQQGEAASPSAGFLSPVAVPWRICSCEELGSVWRAGVQKWQRAACGHDEAARPSQLGLELWCSVGALVCRVSSPLEPSGCHSPCCGTGLWHTCAACSPHADVPCLLPFLVRGLPWLPKCPVATARWPRACWGHASGSWKATERGQGGAGRWQRWDARGQSAAGVPWWSHGGPVGVMLWSCRWAGGCPAPALIRG